jgi:hypothetical protein
MHADRSGRTFRRDGSLVNRLSRCHCYLSRTTWATRIWLIFTVVIDRRFGFLHDDDEEQEVTDRLYWEKRSSKTTVSIANEVLRLLKTLDRGLELKYNRFYISVSKDNKPFNFVIFRPKSGLLRLITAVVFPWDACKQVLSFAVAHKTSRKVDEKV